ncbi:hypothetical protein A0H81_01600 [Grifola frondosa]|uniref:Uncharacterized protein n=1 Tax=Grifola frondosa TaxID=5627 RepID=A0A1C7MNK2_GRIFR|nr:hypothetical protein A0H81_01600 [Grifola frondosa]
MGASKFTAAEVAWLHQQFTSEDVRTILSAQGRGVLCQAANLVASRYTTVKWSEPLPPETVAEFTKRRAGKTVAERQHLQPYTEESEDHRQERLHNVPTRIYNWAKIHYGHHNNPATSNQITPMPIAPIPKPSSPRKATAWDIFKAEHPDIDAPPALTTAAGGKRGDIGAFVKLAKAKFDALPEHERDFFVIKAADMNAQTHNDKPQGESSEGENEAVRAAKAWQLPDHIKHTLKHWRQEMGWIGFCFAGGLDEYGEVSACAEWIGLDAHGCSFESILCEELHWTPAQLRMKFIQFLYTIFGRADTDGGDGKEGATKATIKVPSAETDLPNACADAEISTYETTIPPHLVRKIAQLSVPSVVPSDLVATTHPAELNVDVSVKTALRDVEETDAHRDVGVTSAEDQRIPDVQVVDMIPTGEHLAQPDAEVAEQHAEITAECEPTGPAKIVTALEKKRAAAARARGAAAKKKTNRAPKRDAATAAKKATATPKGVATATAKMATAPLQATTKKAKDEAAGTQGKRPSVDPGPPSA